MESRISITPTPAAEQSCFGQCRAFHDQNSPMHRLRYLLALILVLGSTLVSRADSFYFTRTSGGDNSVNDPQLGYTRLWIWNDATNVQTFQSVLKSGGNPVYVDGIATLPTIGTVTGGTLYGFVNDDITNATLLPIIATNMNSATNMRSRLVTINPTTGAVTFIGASWLSNRMFTGAGFDPLGRLWGIDALQKQICQINITTGAIVGNPINVSFGVATTNDIDFSSSGLGILANSQLAFYLFNPLTGSVNAMSTNSTQVGFDSNLIPPYGVCGIAFTSNLAARNGGPAATSCRFNIVENRGTDQLGTVNDPFTVTPFNVRAEANQSPDPNGGALDNGGPGDMARVGGPFFAGCLTDYGDAPSSYEQGNAAGHSNNIYMSLGTELDIETGPQSSTNATGDDLLDTDDEDALSVVPTLQRLVGGGNVPYTITVPVRNDLNAPLTLAGFLDANQNGVFATTERVTVTVPATGSNAACVSTGANTWNCTLNWSLPVASTSRTTMLRLRLGAATDLSSTTAVATGKIASGEVEDYQVCVAPLITSNISSTTTCSGDLVPITFTTTPTGQQVVWSRSGGTSGSVMGGGNINSVLTNEGTTPVSYTYVAWVPAQDPTGCSSNTVAVTVTVNPRPEIIPSLCSQTICVGQTGVISFTSTIGGTSINWLRVDNGATGSGDISQLFTTAGTYTYKIWGTSPAPASCPVSNTITCTIVVNNACCDLQASIAKTASTNCVTPNGSFTITYSGSSTYQYRLNGGASQALGASPVVVSNLAVGSYTLVITDPASPTCTTTSEIVIGGPGLTVAASSNSPVCATSTLALFATPTGATGNVTYSWAGPNGFSNTAQNPTLSNVTTVATGLYSVTATDQGGCTAISSTSVTITTQPSLTISGGLSQTICSSQATTLMVSGDGGAPVSWINSLGQTGTGTTINFAGIRNVSGQPETVTYILLANAGTCSDRQTVTITIKPAPTLQVYPQQSVICALELTNLTATAFPGTATISWSRNPTLPAPATGNGTGTVTVNESLPAGSYTYTFIATQNGCTSLPVTSSLIVNN